jgi:CheY-like chemotaxis protein/anti-sigma regulatory factor (Ser/Thr protein kinase)
LIDDLLDLTRISRGKLRIRETDCETHSLIGHVVGILRDEAQSKSVAVELQLDAQRSRVRGDPTRLQQVIWNLLRNAIKFTPSGGRVIIRTKDSEGSQLCIEISDTGIGLPTEKIETIFHAFEQAWPENEHQFGGLGLGLAIAKAIVDLHGGEIHAESEGPGKGATFVVHLPSAAESGSLFAGGAGEARQNGDAAEAEQRSLRLLVVEDHEPTLTVLSRLLTKAGHKVSAANSVAAACALAERGDFDVFITDIGLPDGTGLDVLNAIRKIHPGLPGIALSGYGMDEDLKHSMDAGFSAHLIKPVDFDQLRRALREVTSGVGVAAYSRTPLPV